MDNRVNIMTPLGTKPMRIAWHFRLGELFSWCSHRETKPHLPVFLPLQTSPPLFSSSIYPIFLFIFFHSQQQLKSTIGTILQWSRARPSLLPSWGSPGLRYDRHHGSRYCTWYNSHCARMTGVRRLNPRLESPGEGLRSEIILSKLDLDNTSERTCVTFDCSPLCFASSLLASSE